MITTPTTSDIREELKRLFREGKFREGKFGKTVEIQNAHFLADSDTIIREPNYDYAKREIEWYNSQSLYVKDIPGKTPKIWEMCADKYGKINSNYGWCIFSQDNYNQYVHCLLRLIGDHSTREACMIYNRPSMQLDAFENGMHDFMCTYSTQVFLNEIEDGEFKLDYTVFMRSNDAVYGYGNDYTFHKHVRDTLVMDLKVKDTNIKNVVPGDIIWNAGSLHVYSRHFKYLEE